MIRKIEEIQKEQKRVISKISDLTLNGFKSHLDYLKIQYETLFEMLANYYGYGNLNHNDSNQFILCFSLLSDSLRKQKLCVELILEGYYSEAAELTRHIMQSSFTIIYLSKNKDSWKDWFNQQQYEEDKLTKEVRNPRTIFSSGRFKELSESINQIKYYRFFQKLSAWSHPSIESMRSVLDLNPEAHRYFFTNRYNKEKAELLLNVLYGFINTSIWEGFKDIFFIVNEIPDPLKKYKETQDKAIIIFDKFYL